jgi:glucuronoarabinoxylan endo-1,4-beta-xylanase
MRVSSPEDEGRSGGAVIAIDVGTRFQTIDGFGIFGAQDVWWSDSTRLYSHAWAEMVVNDLGITIWRNEYYADEGKQARTWTDKQLPVVRGLKAVSDANHVPLKFVLSVWSPPAGLKCTVGSVEARQLPCQPHAGGLTQGGTLDPSRYNEFTSWILQGIKNYADAGVGLYAISAQNEPMFSEPYNSCVYAIDPNKPGSYENMIARVAPAIRNSYPNVKIFGPENMLAMEAQPYFYLAHFGDAAWSALDIVGYHGYLDGVVPTPASKAASYWTTVRTKWEQPRNKPAWLTETSGFIDQWSGSNGALALGLAIYAALNYGQVSAWIWWQGSSLGQAPTQETLMEGTKVRGKRYYVSKNFYRFVRPGAHAVKVSVSDPQLFVVAFVNPGSRAFTIVAINTAADDRTVTLRGADVPETFEVFRTSIDENCAFVSKMAKSIVLLRGSSVTTLVSGSYQ